MCASSEVRLLGTQVVARTSTCPPSAPRVHCVFPRNPRGDDCRTEEDTLRRRNRTANCAPRHTTHSRQSGSLPLVVGGIYRACGNACLLQCIPAGFPAPNCPDRGHSRTQEDDAVIELTAVHTRAAARGDPVPADQLAHNIETVLRAIVDLTRQAFQIPDAVRIGANLMLPVTVTVTDSSEPQQGCGIVAYDAIPANPSWTRLVLGDLGAGRVFATGKVQAVDDVTDPVWCKLLAANRAKCFVSLPVRASMAEVVAVVNVDASRPMVLNRGNATRLFEVLAPPLMMLSDLLVAASK